jgi:mono/diheme cytochrome c family protein
MPRKRQQHCGKVGPSVERVVWQRTPVQENGTGHRLTKHICVNRFWILQLKSSLGFEKNDTGMPSYAGVLTDSQIQALVLYIKTLK